MTFCKIRKQPFMDYNEIIRRKAKYLARGSLFSNDARIEIEKSFA